MRWFGSIIIAVTLLVAGSSCSRTAQSENVSTSVCVVDAEDRALYSALLNEVGSTLNSKDSNWVFLNRTQEPLHEDLGKWKFEPKGWRFSSKDTGPGDAVVAAFRRSADQECAVLGKLDVTRPVAWISNTEAKALFVPPDPWGSFYKKFPGSMGISSFSRPAYNVAHTEAISLAYRMSAAVCAAKETCTSFAKRAGPGR
jgi:hypothetical protein